MPPTKRTAFLDDHYVRNLQPPTDAKQVIVWDVANNVPGTAGIYVPGLGIRCTAGGVKAFVYNYVTVEGVQRRPKLGRWPAYTVDKARRKAIKWRGEIDDGRDPIGERMTKRQAAAVERKREAEEMTVRELADLFVKDFVSTKKPRTQEGYVSQLRCHVLPSKIADLRINEVSDTDIAALHREISRTAPVQANRTYAMLSRMFSCAKDWKLVPKDFNNPCRGAVTRNREYAKERYPTEAELGAIKAALDAHPNQTHCDAIRLLIFSGGRRNEVLTLQWDHLDLGKSPVWTRPAHLQKANKPHSVPLAPAAAEILRGIRNRQVADGTYRDDGFVFPSATSASGHIVRVKRAWAWVLKQAGIKGMRLHDLRHGFASMLISSGVPIAVVGELLAHASPTTTRRYAHLDKRVTREAVDKVASIFAAAEAPKIASVESLRTSAKRGAS
jgi:integrase